jgi:GPH family glycoside/pentoside/hexuronide:cation symporter
MSPASRIAVAPPSSADERLSLGLCLGFGVGTVGVSIMLNTVTTYFPAFMATVLGQSPQLAGYLLMLSKLADAVIDVAIGLASDRTRSRFGRRKPYLAAGALLSTIAFVMLFSPPAALSLGASQGALVTWMVAALVIYSTAYSLFNVPYMAMPAELTQGFHARTRLIGWRTLFVSAGQLLAMAGTAALIQRGGGGIDGYRTMGLVMALVIGGAMTATALSVPVQHGAPPRRDGALRNRAGRDSKFPGAAQIAAIGRNRPFVLLLCAKAFQFLAFAAIASTGLLYLLNVLGVGYRGQIVLAITQNIVTALVMPLWVMTGRRLGKRWTYMAGVILFCGSALSWLAAGPGITTLGIVVRGAISGAGSGAILLMSVSMLGDTLAYDRLLTGEGREGLLSSTIAVIEKVSFALGVAVLGAFLYALGYVPTTGGKLVAQPESALLALKLGFAVIPTALFAINGLFLWSYGLDETTLAKARADEAT